MPSFNTIAYTQNKFNLQALYNVYPNLKNKIGSKGAEKRLTTSIFTTVPELFSDKNNSEKNIGIVGLINNKRVTKYIDGSLLENHENLDKWKVFVPKSNGSGALGEVLSTPMIGQPMIGHTQTFISFGKFDTEAEAVACLKYIKSKFLRVLLGTLKVTQDNPPATWAKVPLQDFTSDSDIDWSKSITEIDRQLYEKYSLSQEEINFIETNVKEMD